MPSPSYIQVLLQSISGEELEVAMAADATVYDLKQEISELKSIPIPFQVLVAGARPLTDAEELAACDLCGNGALTVMVILSADAVAAALDRLPNPQSGEQTKRDILRNLGMLGPRHSDDVVPVVTKLLDGDLRVAAFTCITQIAGRGNRSAIEAVASQLLNESSRPHVMWALGEISEIGDPNVIQCLTSLLDNEDVEVCVSALEALGKFAGKSHRLAIIAVTHCLADEDAEVRWKAVEVLQQVIAKGDECGIYHTRLLLDHHQSRHVRWAAEEALGRFVDRCVS